MTKFNNFNIKQFKKQIMLKNTVPVFKAKKKIIFLIHKKNMFLLSVRVSIVQTVYPATR